MRKLIYLLIILPIILLPTIVNGATFTDYTTNYYYYDYARNGTETLHTTGYRSGNNNKVTLNGKELDSPTYQTFEFPAGFYNYIPHYVYIGNVYSITMTLTFNSISENEFKESTFNRYKDLNYAHFSNGVINSVNASYSKGNYFTYAGTKYYTWYITIIYNITATSTSSSFYLGSYNTSASSMAFYEHYLSSQYQISQMTSTLVQDGTIVQQNETIINQNNQTNQKLDDIKESTNQTNEKIDETNDKLDDLNDNITSDDVPNSSDTLEDLQDEIATNNVISDLLLLPVTLYQKIINSLNGSCSSFNLGTLYNHNLILPCINLENYLGSSIFTTIDLIISGLFVLVIRKKFVDIFNNMTNLKNGGNEVE